MNGNKMHRRAFIRGAVVGAAGLAIGADALAELISAPVGSTDPDKLGLSTCWNEAPAIGKDRGGNLIVAWTGYQKFSEDIFVLRYRNGKPLPAEKITGQSGPNFSPIIIADSQDGFYVFWVGNRDGKWRILSRTFSRDKWSEEKVVTPMGDQVCIHPAAASIGQGAVLVWERLDNGAPEIWTAGLDGVAYKVADGCRPSITSDGNGAWLAWHTIYSGLYEIHAAHFDGKKWSQPEIVASGDAHFRHPSIAAAPNGDIWLTCEGFVPTRTTHAWEKHYRFDVMCRMLPLSDRTFRRTGSGWRKVPVDPSKRMALRPSLIAGDKRIWIIYYQRTRLHSARKFKTVVTAIENGKWCGDFDCSELIGAGIKNPVAAQERDGKLISAIQTDVRPMVSDPAWSVLEGESHIFVCHIDSIPKNPAEPAPLPGEPSPIFRDPDHSPRPRYSTNVNGQELSVYFGDLHKHCEISMCGQFDGEISENYEYSRDVRGLDFMQSTDHAEHHDEQDWFETRKYASVFNVGGKFAAFAGYEWTSEFSVGDNLRCGHWNPTFLTCGDNLPCLSASRKPSNTPLKHWAALRASLKEGDDVLTILHHPGRKNAPVDWQYDDPDISPLIEIAQSRGSYEYYGCPDTDVLVNDVSRLRGRMVQDGLARGYKLGIIGSGDHSGAPLACVYAPALTRADIFYALKNRRCYGTNGPKIVLDFRVDGRFMGEIFDSQAANHEIKVLACGRSIDRVDIWKDGRIVHTEQVGGRDQTSFSYTDTSAPDRRESYYYARVIQKGMGMAWSSPVWITHTNVDPSVCFYVDDKAEQTVAPSAIVNLPMVIRNERPTAVKVNVKVEAPEGWNCDWTTSDIAARRPGNQPEESVARASGLTVCESEFEVAADSWKEPVVELAAPATPYDGPRPAKLTMTSGPNRITSTVRLGVKEPPKRA